MFELRVLACDNGVCSQEVTKGESIGPELAALRHEMKVVGPNGSGRFAKPMHDIGAVGRVEVSELGKHGEGGA